MKLLVLKIDLWFLFRQSKKSCSILWSVGMFLAFLERARPSKHALLEINSVFYRKVFSVMTQNLDLFGNLAGSNAGCVFA